MPCGRQAVHGRLRPGGQFIHFVDPRQYFRVDLLQLA